jgi:mevalonate kinase
MKRTRLKSGEAEIVRYVKHTESAIEQMHRVLSEPTINLGRFGSLMSSCHGYLNEYMRVSTDTLNRCVTICLANGALGAKLTGTGMGGCMFAVVPESRMAEAREALSTQPVTIYVTHISTSGVFLE